MKIIGFVGMPGSGKSEASEVARSMGLKVVVMGDIIRREAARLGLQGTDQDLGSVGNALRSKEGPAAIARRSLEEAMRSAGPLAVIDGIRSKAEVDYFRAHSQGFHLVEVWAPPEARLRRIAARRRSDDTASEPQGPEAMGISETNCYALKATAEALRKREGREVGWGMKEAIDEADLRIFNLGSIEDLRKEVRSTLEWCLKNKS